MGANYFMIDDQTHLFIEFLVDGILAWFILIKNRKNIWIDLPID